MHSKVEFQSGISEWKCIPEWNFRMEVHSRVEYLRGTKWPLRASVSTVLRFAGVYIDFVCVPVGIRALQHLLQN